MNRFSTEDGAVSKTALRWSLSRWLVHSQIRHRGGPVSKTAYIEEGPIKLLTRTETGYAANKVPTNARLP